MKKKRERNDDQQAPVVGKDLPTHEAAGGVVMIRDEHDSPHLLKTRLLKARAVSYLVPTSALTCLTCTVIFTTGSRGENSYRATRRLVVLRFHRVDRR